MSESGPSGHPSAALHPDDRHEEHGHSSIPYWLVWVALLFFTFLTYATGKQHLGQWALPKERYGSAEEVLRDFAEAERRFALGNAPDDRGRRENIGKVAAEDQSKHP